MTSGPPDTGWSSVRPDRTGRRGSSRRGRRPRLRSRWTASLRWIGSLHDAEGDPAEARRCLEAALALHRAVGDPLHEGDVLRRLALVSARASPDAAEPWLGAAEALLRERGDRGALAEALLARAAIHLRAGRDASASLAEAEVLAVDRPDLLRALGAIVRTGGRASGSSSSPTHPDAFPET